MGSIKFNIKGLEDTLNALDLTERRVNTEVNGGLRSAGELVKSTIEGNTPVLTGEAQSNVVTSRVRTDGGSGHKSIFIGYAPVVSWRMWFLEEGTYDRGRGPKGIAPRKIVANSMKQSESGATEIIRDTISNALG